MQQDNLERIFMEAFTAYSDAIFRFSIIKVSNVQLAEDMTQEVFMRYWQYLKNGNEIQNARALLYTIAHNMAKDWYKKKKSDSLDLQMEHGHIPEDHTADPETRAAYTELIRTMHDLDEQDREVLVLRYVEGLPPKDIADMLGESANTISVRINRATRRLQEKLHI